MRKVSRSELVDYQTWAEKKPVELPRILEVKKARRVAVGAHVTCLFENPDTIRYQVQEMMRVEQLVKEAAILHELETYNELLPPDGALSCTLLIEVPDAQERAKRLREWLALPEHMYARMADGRRVRPRVDARQRDEEKVSSVQFLVFPVGGEVPVAIGCDLPAYTAEATLGAEQRAALRADLSA